MLVGFLLVRAVQLGVRGSFLVAVGAAPLIEQAQPTTITGPQHTPAISFLFFSSLNLLWSCGLK